MKVVFIAHPLKGNIDNNIAKAKALCLLITNQYPDIVPMCPILLYPSYMDDNNPQHRQMGLQYCHELLSRCDEVWLAPHWEHSQGSIAEYRLGVSLNKPVFNVNVHVDKISLSSVPNCDHIICLIGPSGTGKTTVAQLLNQYYGYNVIQSYTTRPKRSPDEYGHIFVDHMPDKVDLIAYTRYHNYEYWATRDQYKWRGVSIYIIDPPGLSTLKQQVNDTNITAIYLYADICTRIDRLTKRDGTLRVQYDKEAFAKSPCNYCVDANGPIEQTVLYVKDIIDEVAGLC